MNFCLWDIANVGMTIWGDIILSLTLFSASLILLGTFIGNATRRKAPRWTQQWEAYLIGIVVSCLGYAAKFNTDSLPIGALFRFSRLTAGLFIIAAVAIVGLALWLRRPEPPPELPPTDD